MDQPDLAALYRLHLVEAAIVEIRKRAAALDPGRELMALIEKLTADHDAKHAVAHSLSSELADIELAQKGIEEKIKKFDFQLYGGSIVNPKEVESIEKEVKILKARNSDLDSKILELWEQIPPAKETEQVSLKKLEQAKQALSEHRKKAMELKSKLEAEFKEHNERLPALVKAVDPALHAKYQLIKERAGGIGMAEITEKGTCARCGTILPERTLVAVKEDKFTLCENCHRILFSVVPAV